jgi:hypothetical protein
MTTTEPPVDLAKAIATRVHCDYRTVLREIHRLRTGGRRRRRTKLMVDIQAALAELGGGV